MLAQPHTILKLGLAATACIAALCIGSPAFAQVQYVEPVNWSRFAGMNGVQPGDAFGSQLTGVLQNETKFLFGWMDAQHSNEAVDNTWVSSSSIVLNPATEMRCYYPVWSGGSESAIRTMAHFTWGTSAMLKTGVYSPSVAGVSESDAYQRTEMAIRGIVFTHEYYKINSLDWGNEWQSAYWAAQVGEAGWMMWDHLTNSTRQALAKVVELEANRFVSYQVPYWANPNGTINTPGDTKAEENAWNSRILTVAQAMMPSNPNVLLWRAKASELMVSAYSRPSDLTNTQMVDGKQVKQWLAGYNMYNNGVVVNHNIVHPDYAIADILRYTTVIDTALANQYTPQSTFFNSDVIYNYLTSLQFTPGASPYGSGNIVSPGGTIYRTSVQSGNLVYDPNLYYPQGTDWSTLRYDDVSLMDLYAEFQGLDIGKSYDAMGWVKARLNAIQSIQNRPGHTGNLYQTGDWVNDWRAKETFALQQLSEEWMLWWLMQHNMTSPLADHWGAVPVPEPGGMLLVVGGCFAILARRGRRKVHSSVIRAR